MASYIFDDDHAAEYGLAEAVFIHHLAYWVEYNERAGKNHHDGRTWMYGTQEEIANHFKFWTIDQFKRVIRSLVDQGVIIKGNFNRTPLDRTTWYAFKIQEKFTKRQNRTIENAESHNGSGEGAQSHIYTTHSKTHGKTTTSASPSPASRVVSFSCLDRLEIPNKLKRKISREHCEADVELAVNRTLAWKSRTSDRVGVLTCLRDKDAWNDENATEGLQSMKILNELKHLDGTTRNGIDISVSTKAKVPYFEASTGNACKIFYLNQKNFIDELKSYVKGKLQIELTPETC